MAFFTYKVGLVGSLGLAIQMLKKLRSWSSQKPRLVHTLLWTKCGSYVQYLSCLCPTKLYCDIDILWRNNIPGQTVDKQWTNRGRGRARSAMTGLNLDNLKTHFGQSIVFMSNICLAYVQPKNTVIYKYFEEISYLDKDWTNRGHAGVLRLSKFSLAAVWPGGKEEKSCVLTLTTFCPPKFWWFGILNEV